MDTIAPLDMDGRPITVGDQVVIALSIGGSDPYLARGRVRELKPDDYFTKLLGDNPPRLRMMIDGFSLLQEYTEQYPHFDGFGVTAGKVHDQILILPSP